MAGDKKSRANIAPAFLQLISSRLKLSKSLGLWINDDILHSIDHHNVGLRHRSLTLPTLKERPKTQWFGSQQNPNFQKVSSLQIFFSDAVKAGWTPPATSCNHVLQQYFHAFCQSYLPLPRFHCLRNWSGSPNLGRSKLKPAAIRAFWALDM